jgi:hypothetical protein
MRSHDRRRLRSSGRAAAARRFVGIAAMSVYAVGRAGGCRPVPDGPRGPRHRVVLDPSCRVAGRVLVIAGIAIFCAGIADEERGYRE